LFENLYKDEDCWIGRYWEPTASCWILGITIESWSLAKYKKYLVIFAKTLAKYPENYIALVKGAKEKKFNEMFGLLSTGIFTEVDNQQYEVMYVPNEAY